jgi:hypothetical protein
MKINKIENKLDFDVEARWNCNSSTHCKTKKYTNKYIENKVANGPAIKLAICSAPIWTGTYTYSTSGWSIF